MWVKATDLDGDPVWVNMLQAQLVVPGEDGGCAVIFGQDDAVNVREEPEQLVRGEPRWPKTSEGVGFIRRVENDAGSSSPAAEFESALVRLMNAQRDVLASSRLGQTVEG